VETVGEGSGRDTGDGIDVVVIAGVVVFIQPDHILFGDHREIAFGQRCRHDFFQHHAACQTVDYGHGFLQQAVGAQPLGNVAGAAQWLEQFPGKFVAVGQVGQDLSRGLLCSGGLFLDGRLLLGNVGSLADNRIFDRW